jgi:predicted HTH domain antitoxin
MQAITLEIPESVAAGYSSLELLKQIIYEDFVANEYQKGAISLREGAQILGLTYETFMVDFLGNRKISFINGTCEELELEEQQEEAWLDEMLGDKK